MKYCGFDWKNNRKKKRGEPLDSDYKNSLRIVSLWFPGMNAITSKQMEAKVTKTQKSMTWKAVDINIKYARVACMLLPQNSSVVVTLHQNLLKLGVGVNVFMSIRNSQILTERFTVESCKNVKCKSHYLAHLLVKLIILNRPEDTHSIFENLLCEGKTAPADMTMLTASMTTKHTTLPPPPPHHSLQFAYWHQDRSRLWAGVDGKVGDLVRPKYWPKLHFDLDVAPEDRTWITTVIPMNAEVRTWKSGWNLMVAHLIVMRYFSQCQGGRLTENRCKLCSESEPILFLILWPSQNPHLPPPRLKHCCSVNLK